MVKIQGSFGNRYVEVAGGRVELKDIEEVIGRIERIDEANGTVSQLFDASRIAGIDHILHSAKLALESLERGRSFADSPRIELTCWAAGLRQINKSLDRVGISKESKEITIVVIGKSSSEASDSLESICEGLGVVRDDEVLQIDDEKVQSITEAFSIPESKLQTSSLKDAVLEEVALLSLEQ